jgi:hypothetical protein
MPVVNKQVVSLPNKNPAKPVVLGNGQRRPATKTGSIVDRIAPIGFDKDEGIKINLYGKSGTGKTTLMATFPKPILVVVCSGSSRPGELRSVDTPEYRKSIKQVVLREAGELFELCDYLSSAEGGKPPYATVVIDHATGLQDLFLKEILGLERIPVAKSWGLASQQQYGQCTTKCKEAFRSLLDLSCNVVIIAQERIFSSDDNSEIIAPTVGAALMPQLAGWLGPACDYVIETFIRQKEEVKRTTIGKGKLAKTIEKRVKVKGEVEYCIRTGPDPVYTTKFRVPKGHPLPPIIVDPSYDKIMSVLRGEKVEGAVYNSPPPDNEEEDEDETEDGNTEEE